MHADSITIHWNKIAMKKNRGNYTQLDVQYQANTHTVFFYTL